MTTVRGTPSLTVAPTQNTAPVFEFRCLYTHDLRKKKKIWHDGSLRFHTFNRRVMVYDDSKNYIGDSHWRETGEFNEGEELKLDKGIMVEVGEQIGHTETDLAPVILEKRRPELASSPPRVPFPSHSYSSMHRPANISQARPKSLAAVLGASQGPIGRARLSARSPFEQRHDNIQQQVERREDRPAKRPKTTSGRTDKENTAHSHTLIGQVHRPAPQASMTANVRGELPSPRRQMSMVPSRAIESTGDVSIPPPPVTPRLASKEKRMSQLDDDLVIESTRSPSPSIPTSPTRSAQAIVPKRLSSTLAMKHNAKQKPFTDYRTVQARKENDAKILADHSATSRRSFQGTVTNKLRFPEEKPRKKLMYRDLLPDLRQERGLSSLLASGRALERDQRDKHRALAKLRSSGKRLPPENPVMHLLSEDEVDLMTVQTPVRGKIQRTSQPTLRPSRIASPSPSPLFVSQSLRSAGSIPSQQSFQDDFDPPLGSRPPSAESVRHKRTDGPQTAQEDSSKGVKDHEEALAANQEPTVPPAVPRAPSDLTVLDQQLLQKPAVTEFPFQETIFHQPLKQRQFRRIRSEGGPNFPSRAETSPSEVPSDEADMMTVGVRPAVEQPQKPFRSPNKVQRSTSDVTHLAQQSEVPGRGVPIAAAVEAVFGPWSEPEAYLLFDWWPPGKEKPLFAISES
jgi:Protein of unknown function (DUF2439)